MTSLDSSEQSAERSSECPVDVRTAAILRSRAVPARFVASISGGGAAFLSDYSAIPGASRFLLEGLVPYSTAATVDFLGFRPENFCSEKTARQLAAAAWRRAVRLDAKPAANGNENDGGDPSFPLPASDLVGIGATASLVTDRVKRGARRVFCAVQTFDRAFSATLRLDQGDRTRAEEERLAADFILSTLVCALERFANVKTDTTDKPTVEPSAIWREYTEDLPIVTDATLRPTDAATVTWADFSGSTVPFAALQTPSSGFASNGDADSNGAKPLVALRFLNGRIDRTVFVGGVRRKPDAADADNKNREPFSEQAVYPGSFNPPHRGHRRIAELTAEITGAPFAFELSVANVDKPPLDPLEILRRVDSLRRAAPDVPVWLTNAPRYVEKATLFPNSTVALGTDAVVRLADPKYENGSVARRDAVLARLAELGTRFLVFPRKLGGELTPPDALPLPAELRALCRFVPPSEFLDDVSSSEIRKAAQAGQTPTDV